MRTLKTKLLAGSAAAFALSAMPALAQDSATSDAATDAAPVFTMDAITSSAERTEKRAVDSLAPVSVRTSEEFERFQPSSADDLLRGIPGVVATTAPGTGPGAGINIRGMEGFGRVNVMVDGARQNFQRTGHGEGTMVFLDPDLIGQVDVVRGPSAAVYGSGAIGGVVNFQTKDAKDLVRPGRTVGGSVTGRLGTNADERSGSVSAYGLADWADLVVSGSYLTRDDYEDGNDDTVVNSGWDQASGLAKLTLTPNQTHQTRLGVTHSRFSYDSGTATVDELDTTTTTFKAQHHLTPGHDLVDLTANAYFTTTKQEETRVQGASLGRDTEVEIETPGFDLFNTSRFALGETDHAVTVGVDGFRDTVDATREGGPLDFTPSGKRRLVGGFVQDELTWNAFSLVGALRFDSYRLKGGGVTSKDDAVSPKLTLGYDILPGLSVYGSWAEAFRAPAVTETLINGTHPPPANFRFLPNPDLKPETAENWELGVNLARNGVLRPDDALRVKASVYKAEVEDYIGTVYNMAFFPWGAPDFANTTYGYENIAEVDMYGGEMEVSYDAGFAYGALALSRSRGKNAITGEKLESGMGDRATLTLGARDRDLGLDFGWRMTGRRDLKHALKDDPTDSSDDPAGGYLLHTAYATYTPTQLDDALTLRLTVDNIFDTVHRDTLRADLPEEGRTVVFGGTVRF